MAHSDLASMPPDLARRARRAYERGRLVAGVRRAAPLAALVALVAFGLDGAAWRLWVGGGAVAAAALAFARGQLVGRAARAGALAALAPLSAPFVATGLHGCTGCTSCPGLPMALCLVVCTAGGAVAGAVTAALAAREAERDRLRFVAGAALMAAWLGSIGCAFAGTAGLAGMAAGLAASGPLLLLARAR